MHNGKDHHDRNTRPAAHLPLPRGTRRSRRRASTCASKPAKSSASSAPTAPARPPPCACSPRCCRPPMARPPSPAATCAANRTGCASASATSASAAAAIPSVSGRQELAVPGAPVRLQRRRGAPADRRTARHPRARGLRRPPHRHLFRRPAPPPRRRPRPDPPPAAAVPRRADHRPRSAGPRPAVGRDPPPARNRHDRVSRPPTTWKRPTRCAIAWRSSTTVGSSPRARPSSSSARSPAT